MPVVEMGFYHVLIFILKRMEDAGTKVPVFAGSLFENPHSAAAQFCTQGQRDPPFLHVSQ